MSEVSLGKIGRQYIQNILQTYSGLSGKLANSISKSGRTFALLPEGTSAARARDFDRGGLTCQKFGLRWILENLGSKPSGTLIVHDVWSRLSDLEVRKPRVDSFFFDENQVYYYLSSRAITLAGLMELQKQTMSFQLVAFYATADVATQCRGWAGHFAPPGYLDGILSQVVAAYVSAYDQESWVVWERQ